MPFKACIIASAITICLAVKCFAVDGPTPSPQPPASKLPAHYNVLELRDISTSYINNTDDIVGDKGNIGLRWSHFQLDRFPDLKEGFVIFNDGGIAGVDQQGRIAIVRGKQVTRLDMHSDYISGLPKACNKSGDLVGSYDVEQGHSRPFLYSEGSVKTLELPAGYLWGYATSINNDGVIVGGVTAEDQNRRGITWKGRIPTLLTPLSDGNSEWADCVNDSGVIVGGSETPISDELHACVWTNGKVTELPTLPWAHQSEPEWINNGSLVVGWSEINDKLRAVIWADGKIHDLNGLISRNPNWILESAEMINDNGVIIGSGIYRGVEDCSFMLTPRESNP